MKELIRVPGNMFIDDRGEVSFINELPKAFKRMYKVRNHEQGFIRAFHGHMFEEKWLCVTRGAVLLCVMDMETSTGLLEPVDRVVLSEKKPELVGIPAGCANGFKTLTDDTEVIFFSDKTLEESKQDDIRFQWDIVGKECWNSVYR